MYEKSVEEIVEVIGTYLNKFMVVALIALGIYLVYLAIRGIARAIVDRRLAECGCDLLSGSFRETHLSNRLDTQRQTLELVERATIDNMKDLARLKKSMVLVEEKDNGLDERIFEKVREAVSGREREWSVDTSEELKETADTLKKTVAKLSKPKKLGRPKKEVVAKKRGRPRKVRMEKK